MLPNPPDKQIEKLQKECYKFIWDNKVDKIKRTVAVRRIKDGGLNIPDLKIYIITLKLNWIRKILNKQRREMGRNNKCYQSRGTPA